MVSEATKGRAPPLSAATISPNVVAAEYAVRGPIAARAAQLAAELKEGKQLPFSKVVACNIGNPQILGQKPITFFRQVLALCDYPELLDDPAAAAAFPADAVARAREYLAAIPGGTGAYTESKGAAVLRRDVAAGIAARDGWPADADDIWLLDGASPGVHYLMKVLLRGPTDAVLTPIPQYPLYSATIKLYGGALAPYYLDEGAGWAAPRAALAAAAARARAAGLTPRALVVINPGNPTGQVLGRAALDEMARFAADEGLVLIADEVYQTNVYAEGAAFCSFKKVVRELGEPAASTLPLASLNSVSKGYFGECGRRGGVLELVNFPADVRAQMLKLASISLCPNVGGQVMAALTARPPAPGEPSYARFAAERDAILASLRRRAELVVAAFNGLEGVTCNAVEGALYAFPRLRLPPGATAAAEAAGEAPDALYCSELLEATGIVTVPGSGFGQQDGTLHLRTTILPPEADVQAVCAAVAAFHAGFMARYGGGSQANGNGAAH